MNKEFEKYEQERERLVKETNSMNFKPISFEIFKKTKEEKELVKEMKKICINI